MRQSKIFRTLGEMPGLSDNNREKAALVLEGQENLIRLIKKYDITTGFGTDLINSAYKKLPEEFTAHPLRKDYPLQGRGERHNFPVLKRAEG